MKLIFNLINCLILYIKNVFDLLKLYPKYCDYLILTKLKLKRMKLILLEKVCII